MLLGILSLVLIIGVAAAWSWLLITVGPEQPKYWAEKFRRDQ